MIKDCTIKLLPPTNKLQHQGRVFTLNIKEATQSDDLIQGKCKVNGKTLTVVYDSSATHSFISHDCVNRWEFPMSELPYMLIVSTLIRRLVKTCHCCLKCCF